MSSRATRERAARAIALRVRNIHRKVGRQVTQEEVLVHARPGHRMCKAITGKPAGVVFDPRKGTYHFCKCATEGLIEEHPEVILYEDGRAFWPAEDEDDEPAAQGGGHGKETDQGTTDDPGPDRDPA
jgi:hypothetical protein